MKFKNVEELIKFIDTAPIEEVTKLLEKYFEFENNNNFEEI